MLRIRKEDREQLRRSDVQRRDWVCQEKMLKVELQEVDGVRKRRRLDEGR